jgi:YbbR domain-containing protein
LINRKLLIKITEKWPVKVLSVAAALIISIFFRMNTLESRFFSVPLRIESVNELVPASSYPQLVRVSLRGEPNSLNPVLEEDIEAYVDLTKYTNEGSYRIPIHIRKKGSALGVDALEISVEPIEIHIKLEEKISRNIDVSPVFRGSLAEGYELINQHIVPTSIIAEGPRSSMESIIEFVTGTIDLDGRFEDFSVYINILNNDPLIVIHGNRMIEYRGTIRRISREGQRNIIVEPPVNTHTLGDNEQ